MYKVEQCGEALRVSESTIEVVRPNILGGNILEILWFGIMFQLMLYGCGGSVVATRNMNALSTPCWI